MIVQMKKVSLVVLDETRKESLKKLRKLGVVHLEQIEGRGPVLASFKDAFAKTERSLSILDDQKVAKKRMPAQRSVADNKQVLAKCEDIIALSEKKKSLLDKIASSTQELERFAKWGSVNPADFAYLAEKGTFLYMKASSVEETILANEAFASRSDIPLHIGVTEAGPLIIGVVKSTLAFSTLLKEGIGSTIRVSLSSTPENEVVAGRSILHECGMRQEGVTIISCPRCGRVGFDVHSFIDRWQNELLALKKNITVAVMGCVVNGPGEGKHADLGIAGSGSKVVIFKKGKIVRTIDSEDADKVFREELESL